MHDSHIHLSMEPLRSNLDQVLSLFVQNGGKHILTQGTDILDYDGNFEITEKYNKIYPNLIQVAIGIHPEFFEENTIMKDIQENIYERSQKMNLQFEDIFKKRKDEISAIGECGLDYYHFQLDKSYEKDIVEQLKEVQKISLRKHLQLALENSLPVSIHARDILGSDLCVKDIIRIVAEEGKGLLKGSFHSYTGSMESLNEILDMGFSVGFNAIITYKSGENVREILKNTPLERILFETDGPFLPPQSVRKKKSIKVKFAQPNDVKEIMTVASEIKNVTLEHMEKVSDENYEKVFL